MTIQRFASKRLTNLVNIYQIGSYYLERIFVTPQGVIRRIKNAPDELNQMANDSTKSGMTEEAAILDQYVGKMAEINKSISRVQTSAQNQAMNGRTLSVVGGFLTVLLFYGVVMMTPLLRNFSNEIMVSQTASNKDLKLDDTHGKSPIVTMSEKKLIEVPSPSRMSQSAMYKSDFLVAVSATTDPVVLSPGEFTVLTFTSGVFPRDRQEVRLNLNEPGRYTILLTNHNPPASEHWIIWDYIGLKGDDEVIWGIGEDESPDDFSEAAFGEFCNPEDSNNCITEFTVGETAISEFSKDLNDWTFPEAKINFVLSAQQVTEDLMLTLSTLYSVHLGSTKFDMKVSLVRN